MNVLKANGELAPFDAGKIRRSLRRVNANPIVIEQVIHAVEQEIYEGIPTSKLFRIVFRELKKTQRNIAGKYNLKRTIMELGPTGFPFEKLIAGIWRAEGYSVETGIIVRGECVGHEVDVVAERGELREFIECKHHSIGGKTCDVKTALYISARFLDIEKKLNAGAGSSGTKFKGWLVTNTRFTSDAIDYGTCAALNLLSWNFPPKNSLRERIEAAGLHPITCLTSITKNQKKRLMENGITLCSDLGSDPGALEKIGVRGNKVKAVLKEASGICETSARQ